MDALFKILLAAVIGTVIVAIVLSWQTIESWFIQNKDTNSKYGVVIKQALSNGNYTVIAGVFTASDQLTSSNKWENTTLDQNTLQYFGNSDQLIYNLI